MYSEAERGLEKESNGNTGEVEVLLEPSTQSARHVGGTGGAAALSGSEFGLFTWSASVKACGFDPSGNGVSHREPGSGSAVFREI